MRLSRGVKGSPPALISRTGSASDWCALQEALYKDIETIKYNNHLSSHMQKHFRRTFSENVSAHGADDYVYV